MKTDWEKCLREAQNHQSTALAAEIASSTSWLKLWDMALDHGHQGTVSLQALFRELTRPTFGSKPCHRCDIDHLHEPYFNHFISSHSTIGVSPTTIVRQLRPGCIRVCQTVSARNLTLCNWRAGASQPSRTSGSDLCI